MSDHPGVSADVHFDAKHVTTTKHKFIALEGVGYGHATLYPRDSAALVALRDACNELLARWS